MAATKTSTKTPRKPPAKSKTSAKPKTPAPKQKTKPNHSILSFFKKLEDENLFVEDGPNRGLEEGNIYDVEDGAKPVPDEKRFNEVDGAVKKRKLSPGTDEDDIISERIEESKLVSPMVKGLVANCGEDVGKENMPLENPSVPPQKKKAKRTIGGFINDSDSSDDEDESPPTSKTTPVEETKPSIIETKPDSPAPNPPGARSTSGIPFLHQETSAQLQIKNDPDDEDGSELDADQFPDDFVDEEDEELGEEFRHRQYMQEQARLEAEAEGDDYNPEEDPVLPDDAMVEFCPICEGSLTGVSSDAATAHVNSCLDGKPTPLPKPAPPTNMKIEPGNEVSSTTLSKRFSRAAVPRAGQANPITLGTDPSKSTSAGPASAFTKLMSTHAEDAAWSAAAASEQSSRGKQAYQRTCPFYKIMPGLSICVDAFRYGAVAGCKAYFLSHFHSDHYIGLTANWTHGPIYCSAVTGSLVRTQLKTAARFVVELEFEKKTPIPGTGVDVTMIPANHCPGSSLFLFEKTLSSGKTQRILHCGDFRACPAHVAHPALRPDIVDVVSGKTKQQKIDVCYLDTTYLNPRYSFPPQDDVIRACAEVCRVLDVDLKAGKEDEWKALLKRREGGAPRGETAVDKFFIAGDRDNPKNAKDKSKKKTPKESEPNAFTALNTRAPRLLIVCGTYSIGKERICKAIAQALKTKIFASKSKIKIVHQLGDPELSALMTTDPSEAQVHMQMLMELRAETLAEYLELHRPHFSKIIGFRPSGWSYRPAAGVGGGAGGIAGSGAVGSGRVVSANLPPSSVPLTTLLHGTGWRTRFDRTHLSPQRGSSKDAMCFGVPYSEHSSFRELCLFLMALRVEKVVPTVNVGSEVGRKRMRGWTERWLGERRRGGLVRVLREEDGDEEGEKKRKVKMWEGKDGVGGGVYW